MTEIRLSEMGQIDISVVREAEFQIGLGSEIIIADKYAEYEGPSVVTPSSAEQTLFTADRVIKEDINIKSIPYTEIANYAGGNTAIIG